MGVKSEGLLPLFAQVKQSPGSNAERLTVRKDEPGYFEP